MGHWLVETLEREADENAQPIADAVWAQFVITLPPVLATESFMESVSVWKRWTTQAIPGNVLNGGTNGTRPGRALSNDNALFVNLRQDTVNARFNGAFYIAGLSENDQDNNLWDETFLNGPVQTFLDVFDAAIVPGDVNGGSFAWAVLSKRFTPPSTSIGTAFEVFKAVPSNRVATQRRRRNKVVGWANA